MELLISPTTVPRFLSGYFISPEVEPEVDPDGVDGLDGLDGSAGFLITSALPRYVRTPVILFVGTTIVLLGAMPSSQVTSPRPSNVVIVSTVSPLSATWQKILSSSPVLIT